MPSSATLTQSFETVAPYFVQLQAQIVAALAKIEGQPFRTDSWQRPQGGGGTSQLLENGQVFERAAVLFSQVAGACLPVSASAQRPHLANRAWHATGISLVIHPRNPYVPIVHMNLRLFVALPHEREREGEGEGEKAPVFWFGGGMDLTPCYPFEEDAQHFHQTCYQALAPHGDAYYPRYKHWCDTYFFLKHRGEMRGIGGLFFDDLQEPGFEACFALVRDVGAAFLPAYMPILKRRHPQPYGARERDFQAYRRGRYVEFNLLYDRGTLFGLQSDGRTESILLSMPPVAAWRYDWQPTPGTPEAALSPFLQARDWL